jgi:hypothetical protein
MKMMASIINGINNGIYHENNENESETMASKKRK